MATIIKNSTFVYISSLYTIDNKKETQCNIKINIKNIPYIKANHISELDNCYILVRWSDCVFYIGDVTSNSKTFPSVIVPTLFNYAIIDNDIYKLGKLKRISKNIKTWTNAGNIGIFVCSSNNDLFYTSDTYLPIDTIKENKYVVGNIRDSLIIPFELLDSFIESYFIDYDLIDIKNGTLIKDSDGSSAIVIKQSCNIYKKYYVKDKKMKTIPWYKIKTELSQCL